MHPSSPLPPRGAGQPALWYRARQAFTLVEMLVVVSIIGLVVTLLAPALKDFGRGSALQTSGNLITNLVTLARQTAMSKNTMTALVLLAEQGTMEDYRAFTILEYSPDSGWAQTNPWEVLPSGITVDFTVPTKESSFLKNPQGTVFPRLTTQTSKGNIVQHDPPVKYNQQEIDTGKGYAARVFLPTGALYSSALPAQIRIVEGFKADKLVNYTHRKDKGAANYFDIAIIGATGAVKMSRP